MDVEALAPPLSTGPTLGEGTPVHCGSLGTLDPSDLEWTPGWCGPPGPPGQNGTFGTLLSQ